MQLRLLLDENLSPDLVTTLEQLVPGVDIKYVRGPDSPPLGTPDPEILLFCEAEQRMLVTNNRKTMPGHERAHFSNGHHHFGIVYLRDGFSYGEYAEALHLLVGASEAEEWVDRSDWIPY